MINFNPDTPKRYIGCLFTRVGGSYHGRTYLMVYVCADEVALIDVVTGQRWSSAPNGFGLTDLNKGWRLLKPGTMAHVITKATEDMFLEPPNEMNVGKVEQELI